MKRDLPSIEEAVHILRTVRTRRAPKAPPPVNRQIAPLLKSLNDRFESYDTGAGRLKSRWPEIVGETVARLSEPAKVIKGKIGTLELRVEGAYAAAIQHQSQPIIDRVNLFLGAGTIGRLRIIQGPVTKARTTTAAQPVKPLSAVEDLKLQQSLNDVSDEKLKRELLKLGRAVLQKQKP
ncbi:MAG: DciA family protein [Asticcacaulis sp.]